MTTGPSRRTVLKGATALAALSSLPAGLSAQTGPAASLPARGDILDPRRQRADRGRKARRLCERRRPHPQRRHCRGRCRRQRPRRGGDRRARHDLHAGLHRHPLAPLDQHAAAVRALRRRRAERVPGLHPPRAAHDAAGPSGQREARHCRGAERGRHHGAQLVPQHAHPGARGRRAFHHARHRHPRPVRLRPGARHAGRPDDGPRGPRPYPASLDAGRRYAHARHLFAQCRRRQHRRRCARLPLDRHGEERLGWRAGARPADHLAYLRPEPDQDAGGGAACSVPMCNSCTRC